MCRLPFSVHLLLHCCKHCLQHHACCNAHQLTIISVLAPASLILQPTCTVYYSCRECIHTGYCYAQQDAPLLASEIEAAVRGTWSAPCAEGALADPLVFGDFESAVARLGGASSDNQDAAPLTKNRDAVTDGDTPAASGK
jgi:hypothetical protein